jgi:uncharacterized protein
MLFRQRKRQTRWEQFRLWLWPRVSWRRSSSYYLKRILRLSGTPYAIAMGAAVGAAMSFTPFIGFHIALAAAMSWMLRGNLIAAALGTAVGNPLTLPFIWATTYEVGHFLLRGASREAPSGFEQLMNRPFEQILPLIKPMLAGAVPLGLMAGVLVFAVTYKGVDAYQETRRRHLARRREGLEMATAAGRRNG